MTVTMRQHGVYRRRDGAAFTQNTDPCRQAGLWEGSDGYLRRTDGLAYGHSRTADGLAAYGCPPAETSWDAIEEITPTAPTLFRDMTDAEQGDLLLAHHKGEKIEVNCPLHENWLEISNPSFRPHLAYRRKPAPVRETVTLFGRNCGGSASSRWSFLPTGHINPDSHSLTLATLDGAPITGVFRNEDGEKIVVEKIND